MIMMMMCLVGVIVAVAAWVTPPRPLRPGTWLCVLLLCTLWWWCVFKHVWLKRGVSVRVSGRNQTITMLMGTADVIVAAPS